MGEKARIDHSSINTKSTGGCGGGAYSLIFMLTLRFNKKQWQPIPSLTTTTDYKPAGADKRKVSQIPQRKPMGNTY